MRQRIIIIILDFFSSITLGLGIWLATLPLILNLWYGFNNDTYLVHYEGTNPAYRGQAIALGWIFGIEFALEASIIIIIGIGLRWLTRHHFHE